MKYKALIKKFGKMGEKTGWSYIDIPGDVAEKIRPGNRKSFRVKGTIDAVELDKVAALPMGNGDFILPLNLPMRKKLGKRAGETVTVSLSADENDLELPEAFKACLEDEPGAQQFFISLSKSHQHYFIKWISSARTENTMASRIAASITALCLRQNYVEMVRARKRDRDALFDN